MTGRERTAEARHAALTTAPVHSRTKHVQPTHCRPTAEPPEPQPTPDHARQSWRSERPLANARRGRHTAHAATQHSTRANARKATSRSTKTATREQIFFFVFFVVEERAQAGLCTARRPRYAPASGAKQRRTPRRIPSKPQSLFLASCGLVGSRAVRNQKSARSKYFGLSACRLPTTVLAPESAPASGSVYTAVSRLLRVE